MILLSSPLTGLFFRTLTFLEYDIKPVFVLDGRPPAEKRAVVSKDQQCTLEISQVNDLYKQSWMKPLFLLQLEKRAELAGWSSPNHTGTGTHLGTT